MMKDEIKEILNYLKKKENTRRIKCITIEESKQLLDYITNLQEEKFVYKQRNEKAIEDLEKTKELNDKHILARDNIIIHLDIDHIEYLLNILKGGDDDENIK